MEIERKKQTNKKKLFTVCILRKFSGRSFFFSLQLHVSNLSYASLPVAVVIHSLKISKTAIPICVTDFLPICFPFSDLPWRRFQCQCSYSLWPSPTLWPKTPQSNPELRRTRRSPHPNCPRPSPEVGVSFVAASNAASLGS